MNNVKQNLKTEYVKVADSIFDLKEDLKRGNLFYKAKARFIVIKTPRFLSDIFSRDELYRKVESEITWQTELKDFATGCCLDVCIEVAEQDPDGFIKMCKLVNDAVNNGGK
jgi:hypothetical protein